MCFSLQSFRVLYRAEKELFGELGVRTNDPIQQVVTSPRAIERLML
jgi:hypothetical protein